MEKSLNSFVYIWPGEHGAYWREGGHGYTTDKSRAGVFLKSGSLYLTGKSYSDKMIELIPAAPEYEI